jgi:acetyl esterase/lipase
MLRFVVICLCLANTAQAAPRESRDVAYGSDRKQRYDVYWDDALKGAPMIVMLHGGAWAIGDKGHRWVWKDKAAHFRAEGWVFVSVNTRLLPEAAPDAQARDLAEALADIQRRGAEWGGNGGNVVLMGHSAGAHLAALVGTDLDLQRKHRIKPLRAVVSLDSATLDVPAAMETRPSRLSRNAFGTDPDYWPDVSPSHQLDRGAPPVLAVCSTRRPAPCPDARDLKRTGSRKGVPVTVLPVALSHGEINGELGKPSTYTDAVTGWIADRVR